MATGTVYNSFWRDLFVGSVVPGSDAFKLMLVTGYTVDKDAHTKRSDVISKEITGTNYTAGGKATAVTVTEDTTNDRTDAAFAGTSWPTSTISATGAVIYKARGGAASADELVAYIDFGGVVASTADAWTITDSIIRVQN